MLAQAPDEETVIAATLERRRVDAIRERFPSLASRRPAAYRWPAPV